MSRAVRLAPLALAALAACNRDSTPPDNGNGGPPIDCVATDAAAATTALAVGEVKVLTGNTVNCVRLAPGASAATYIAVVSHVGATPDLAPAFNVGVDAPPVAALVGDVAAAERRARLTGAMTAVPRMHDAHERLLARARELDLVGARAERARAASLPAGIRGAVFPAGSTPTAGQTAQIRVPSLARGSQPCDDFTTITATVRFVSQRAVIMQDNAAPANGFTAGDFQSIATEFDNLIYPTDTAYFGRGGDVDANGGRVIILYTPEVNKGTPRGATSLLAGFFWAGDLFPRTGTNGCNQSNGSEVFYLLVPDPTGIHSNVRSVSDIREKTRGTVAHEFEHMLNAGSRLTNPAVSDFEDVWLDEALAHFAEEAVGRAKLGVGETTELTHAAVFDLQNGLRDYNAFFYQNLERFDDWLRSPNTKAPISEQADSSLAVRGAGWALLRYAADHYGGGDPKQFTRRLAAGPGVGVANFTSKLSGGATLETVLTGWHAANYADNLGIPNLPVRYTYRSWNMRDAISNLNGGAYSLAVMSLPGDGNFTSSVRSSGGASYFRLNVPAGQAGALQLTNGQGTMAGFPDGRLVLLRAQ